MAELSKAFSRNEASLPKTTFFDKLRSAFQLSSLYPNEKPEVPLKVVGNYFEKKRLTRLINTIARNSPTGRQILEDAAKGDYILGFENISDCHGACNPTSRVLMLNPRCNDDKLVTTLAHEGRHAQQHTTGKFPELRKCDVATEIKLRRACEADAQAAAVQTALEIRAATRNPAAWREFSEEYEDIAYAAEKKVSLLPNAEEVKKKQPEVMAAAFKEWFNDKEMIDSYEKSYLIFPMMKCTYAFPINRRLSFYGTNMFLQSFTSEQIVTSMCKTASGECYLKGEKNILDTPQMCSVFPLTKEVATAFFAKRYEDIGVFVDKSFIDLPTKKETASLAPARRFIEEQEAKKAVKRFIKETDWLKHANNFTEKQEPQKTTKIERKQNNNSSEVSAVLAAKRQR